MTVRLTVEVDLVVDDDAGLDDIRAAIARAAAGDVAVRAWRIVPRSDPRRRAGGRTLGPGPVEVTALADPPGAAWHVLSTYVETYWLPLIGPTPLLAMRRLAAPLEAFPGYVVDQVDLAAELGVRPPQLDRTLVRLSQFGFVYFAPGRLGVATNLPSLSRRMVHRLPGRLADAHERLAQSA